VIHIYEIEGHGTYWEVWRDHPGMPWHDEYIRTLESQNEFDLYLDICRRQGVDFILHTLEDYDEYNLAVPSV